MPGPDLQPLVDRAKAGDEGAWSEIWSALYEPMVGYCERTSKLTRQDSEEVVANALYKAWARLNDFTHGNFAAWAFFIAKREAIDRYRFNHKECRDERRSLPIAGLTPWSEGTDHETPAREGTYLHSHIPGPEEVVIWRETLSEEWERVKALGRPAAARVFAAFMTQGEMSQSEVAEYLGIPLGTVKSAFRMGRDQVKYRPEWAKEGA